MLVVDDQGVQLRHPRERSGNPAGKIPRFKEPALLLVALLVRRNPINKAIVPVPSGRSGSIVRDGLPDQLDMGPRAIQEVHKLHLGAIVKIYANYPNPAGNGRVFGDLVDPVEGCLVECHMDLWQKKLGSHVGKPAAGQAEVLHAQH